MMPRSYIDILERTVAAGVGRPIVEVLYRTYVETTPQAVVDSGAGWFIGELYLRFEQSPALFLSWGENEGFGDHFSLFPSDSTTYEPNTLAALSAHAAPEWSQLIGEPLAQGVLLGSNGTPHVLVLEFPSGGVAIGDGYDQGFGDGDQILVHSLPEPQLANFQDVFWRTPALTNNGRPGSARLPA